MRRMSTMQMITLALQVEVHTHSHEKPNPTHFRVAHAQTQDIRMRRENVGALTHGVRSVCSDTVSVQSMCVNSMQTPHVVNANACEVNVA